MEYHATLLIMILFAIACFIVGLDKAGFGGTLGFLATPLVALALPVKVAVGLVLPVLMIGDAFTMMAYWGKWDMRKVWLLLAGVAIGIALATLVLVNMSADLLKKGLAVMAILFILYRLLAKRLLSRLTYIPRPWHGVLTGSLAGFGSVLANAGGPPLTIYLLLQALPATTLIATAGLFFTILNYIRVPLYLSAGIIHFELLRELIWFTVLVPVGVLVGRKFVGTVDQTVFETAIIILLSISAVLLLF